MMMGQIVPPCCCSNPPPYVSVRRRVYYTPELDFFKHGLSDIIEETTRYDTIKADEGNFFVCNGILLNKLPEKVANVAQYDETTTNHTGVHT